MRRILVDHARARHYQKRGGPRRTVTFDEALVVTNEPARTSSRSTMRSRRWRNSTSGRAASIELRFFGGLSVEETAVGPESSPATVMGDWRLAKAWLKREMRGEHER